MEQIHGHGASELFQAQSHLYKHVFSFVGSMSLKCAVQLGIPDIIHSHGEPITLHGLVSALQIHPTKAGFVHRLMRLLAHCGFFATTRVNKKQEEEEDEEEAYDITPSSRILLKENVTSLSPFVLAMLEPALVTPWQFLGNWFREDKVTAFESAHGMGLWEYGNQNPVFNNLFNEAMASDSGMMNLVVRDCKAVFEGLDTLIDVGGGTGTCSRIISEAFPHLKCTVFDLPHVVANLTDSLKLNYVGGDMFQSIPPTDGILLKLVLHSISDEDCVKVLKKCREAILNKEKGGKVIIIDIVINDIKDEHEITEAKLFFDVLMMALVTGRERCEKEWEKLFLEAGFSRYKITPMFGLRSLIEVYP
ncbi:trans-resveratrol di-O-methyltransferase-like [Corylus avellana]|uniref:trans-resveratrol di-O-methyltransferase-like n=1 Tax=Corylus avellana TaxID=13451 RepID=UPI00286ACBEF|nr:trans-resveratrol di-O-methyltransferase-like [Corylus avellana]